MHFALGANHVIARALARSNLTVAQPEIASPLRARNDRSKLGLKEIHSKATYEANSPSRGLSPELAYRSSRTCSAPVERNLHLVWDPRDVPIVLAAISAEVDYLVTNDKDLTAQDETTATLRQKIQPMIVGQFLSEIMGWEGEDLERIRKRNLRDL